jgi:hypothetical protein
MDNGIYPASNADFIRELENPTVPGARDADADEGTR